VPKKRGRPRKLVAAEPIATTITEEPIVRKTSKAKSKTNLKQTDE
jgi:hypothetical protein